MILKVTLFMMLLSTSLQRFYSYHHLPVTNLKEEGRKDHRTHKEQKTSTNTKKSLLANFSLMNPVLNLVKKIFLIPEVNAYQTHARSKS